MRLRLADILAENSRKGRKPATAYQLAKMSGLSMSTAARLARDEWECLHRDVLITLCEVLDLDHPGQLFDGARGKVRRGRRS